MSTSKNIGRYELIDELGHGAMGSVFRAHDPAMNRDVALKTILPVALAGEQGDEFRQRFYREARAAGALAHPGIVPVFDVGEHEGVPFLVMEFVKGQTLDNAIKKGGRFTLERVCEIGQQIADALGYAHRNGVIHRDIKPANILLTSPEAYGDERPKITDFGVAKLTAGEITTTGQLLGTPAFMPPEQFTGAPIDGRADLFSLGVILYWMATGEQPFPGETVTAVSYKIVHTEPIPPSKLNPAVPPELEGVILKCLAKSPATRYQTGEEIAQDLALLRAGSRAASLQATGQLNRAMGQPSVQTIPSNPSLTPIQIPATTPLQPQKLKKRGAVLLAMAAFVAATVFGSWYWEDRHSVPQQPPTMGMEISQPDQTQSPATAANPETTPKATTAAAVHPAKSPAASPAAAPAASPAASPAANAQQPPPVSFNPKSLDPRQNTRLKIELEHFPYDLAYSVTMNGKSFFKGTTGNSRDSENLFVPPGVHEFRVTVFAGRLQKTSNTVSAEFLANKHMTLKVELRPPASSFTAASKALGPDAQIVASLKTERFTGNRIFTLPH